MTSLFEAGARARSSQKLPGMERWSVPELSSGSFRVPQIARRRTTCAAAGLPLGA